jgi:hypothetical protein
MTNLPATLVESEALAFARKFVIGLHRTGGPWSGHSPFSDIESRAFVRQIFRQMLPFASLRLQLTALARAGDPDARDVLHTLMIEAKSRGEDLPIELEGYNMEVLAGGTRHRSPDGPKRKNKFTRHMFIALTVAAVVDRFGLPPTGRSPHRRSACSIVAEALREIGMQLGSAAVEKIWNKYRGGMPTAPGWATAWASAF